MKKFKIKGNIQGIVGVIVIVILMIGIIALLASIFGSTTKKISSSSFAVGGLDAGGEYRETDKSLYSKEAFCCQGLKIEKAFESKSRYEVYYYREDNSFIGQTDVLTDHTYEKGNTFPNAMYARIVITPKLDADEKLSFLNKGKYASEFKITVLADQTFEVPMLSIFPNVRDDYNDRVNYSGTYHHALLADGPFVFANADMSSKTVKEISLPVSGVVNHQEESKITIYVVEKIATGSTVSFKKISSQELTLPEFTFNTSLGKSLTLEDNAHGDPVNSENWVSWEVSITLKENQTIAIGDPSDTIYFSYRKGSDVQSYYIYNDAFNTPALVQIQVYADIKVLE